MRPQRLFDYTTHLLSVGRVIFSRDEARKSLGISGGAFLDAAERLQQKGCLFTPRRGFYVVVPPQFRSWGAPPPSWYIDELMRHEGRPYYVGFLKAAELLGAAPQAVMEFQVITDRQIPKIQAGRSVIAFYFRRNLVAIANGIEDHKTDTGKMKVSSAELTALDLVRYPRAAGGVSHVASVLSELAERIQPGKLSSLSKSFERSVAQRLGYILTRTGHESRAGLLLRRLTSKRPIPWVELDPAEIGDPNLSKPPRERDSRWRVVVRSAPEADS